MVFYSLAFCRGIFSKIAICFATAYEDLIIRNPLLSVSLSITRMLDSCSIANSRQAVSFEYIYLQ